MIYNIFLSFCVAYNMEATYKYIEKILMDFIEQVKVVGPNEVNSGKKDFEAVRNLFWMGLIQLIVLFLAAAKVVVFPNIWLDNKITVVAAAVFMGCCSFVIFIKAVCFVTQKKTNASEGAVHQVHNESSIGVENLKCLHNPSFRILDSLKENEYFLGYFGCESDDQQTICVTSGLADLFGFGTSGPGYFTKVDKKEWNSLLESVMAKPYIGMPNTYVFDRFTSIADIMYLQIVFVSGEPMCGYVLDETSDVGIERARHLDFKYDRMTGLLNLKTFKNKIIDIQEQAGGKTGVMLSIGLDNLKYVNSTYGHEAGDRYIIQAASHLQGFRSIGGIAARVSGDEFAVYIQGFDSKNLCRDSVEKFIEKLKNQEISIHSDSRLRLRFTVGMAYYPDDSRNTLDLHRYSSFAMTQAKQLRKGTAFDFCRKSYAKNSYWMDKREDINRLIDENLVRYVFQPIIDIKTFTIYGYEALMRPEIDEIKSPLEVLELAASQSKLYYIEKMTVFNVMEWTDKNIDLIGNKKIFFNTIPNQSMTYEDEQYLFAKYSHLFDSLVFEITEGEISDEQTFNKKMHIIRDLFKSSIAIDDFGSGFSNEMRIINISPSIIKIDKGLIRNIDNDIDKQIMVSNLVMYCKKRNIKSLAEGVETQGEFEHVCKLGMDMAQGYYISYPEYNPALELPEHIIKYRK